MVVGKLARGAISLTGNIHTGDEDHSSTNGEQKAVVVSLRILAKEKLKELQGSLAGVACVNPEEPGLSGVLKASTSGGRCLLTLTSGSDCVITTRASEHVPIGHIALVEEHLYNLHCAEGEAGRNFSLFTLPGPSQGFTLCDLTLEVRPRDLTRHRQNGEEGPDAQHPGEETGGDVVEGAEVTDIEDAELAQAMGNRLFGCVVAVGEVIPFNFRGMDLVLRVTVTNNKDLEDQQDMVLYHCYRGLVSGDTTVYVEEAEGFTRGQLRLLHPRPRPTLQDNMAGHLIHVSTSDGELFPVKKKLLRPCISLTRAVQDKDRHKAPEVQVQVDCLTFDRVLLFLEAEALGRLCEFNVDINLVDDLLQAALELKCRPLEDFCKKILGEFESRIREYTYEEIKSANASGKCWILVANMVLDVTHWLPEHPGGSKIIPAQALNIDATCFYELYHVSKESFMYLKQFYIGEICEADRELVPCAESASEHFIQQLQEYTSFRIKTKPLVSSFHLGLKA